MFARTYAVTVRFYLGDGNVHIVASTEIAATRLVEAEAAS